MSNIKRKLLFTLGCSFTEGDGAYPDEPFFEPEGIPLDGSRRIEIHGTPLQQKYRNTYTDDFHKNSWPAGLVKKLGYDKLINVGKCASSTSYQVKLLFDKYWKFPFKDYETLMIIYVTDSARYSFYSGGAPQTFMAGSPERPWSLSGRYARIIQNNDMDPMLEQIHHIKTLEGFCKSRDITLKVMNYHTREDYIMKKYYLTDIYMDSKVWDPLPFSHQQESYDDWDNRFHSPICFHPNREGYRLMTECVYDKIKELHPHLLRTEGFNKYPELVWDGDFENFPNIENNRINFNHEGLAPGEDEYYKKTGKPFM